MPLVHPIKVAIGGRGLLGTVAWLSDKASMNRFLDYLVTTRATKQLGRFTPLHFVPTANTEINRCATKHIALDA